MMFASDRIKLTLATIHVPLSAVPGLLTRALIAEKIGLTARALRSWWGLRRPRIDVLGLNPHAGEGGMMGSEERRIIRPAVARCHERNCAVTGPLSAEAGLRRALEGRCDALVAMYHDQGLLPLKALGGATNVTLGLPFVRTSPDHGTAMDIAWRNRADPGPMVRAVLLAARLAAE
jgi:4-hydroxythreonine-4-phosphate dehydrogenase